MRFLANSGAISCPALLKLPRNGYYEKPTQLKERHHREGEQIRIRRSLTMARIKSTSWKSINLTPAACFSPQRWPVMRTGERGLRRQMTRLLLLPAVLHVASHLLG